MPLLTEEEKREKKRIYDQLRWKREHPEPTPRDQYKRPSYYNRRPRTERTVSLEPQPNVTIIPDPLPETVQIQQIKIQKPQPIKAQNIQPVQQIINSNNPYLMVSNTAMRK